MDVPRSLAGCFCCRLALLFRSSFDIRQITQHGPTPATRLIFALFVQMVGRKSSSLSRRRSWQLSTHNGRELRPMAVHSH